MSAFSRSLAALQTLAVAAWGPDVKLHFTCELDIPFDPEVGTAGGEAWHAWLSDPAPYIVAVSNTGVGVLDELLLRVRASLDQSDTLPPSAPELPAGDSNLAAG